MSNGVERVYLSPPHLGDFEWTLVQEALASGWIAPVGPHIEAFEKEFAETVGVPYAVAVSSGTAAIHLALRLVDVQPNEEVFCSTLTFSASANPIVYEGGRPFFIDSDRSTWNMDPDLLWAELRDRARLGRLPRAVVVVDLYGQSADYDRILGACREHEVPVIEDAAEALGATYKGRSAGQFGKLSAFSFNGNKIITTSGGGMLVSSDQALIERARFLASQARDEAPHYEHSTVGYNYRMSNVLAALGRGQLKLLRERVAARRKNFEYYRSALGDLPGIEFMPEAMYGGSTRWLTCLAIEPTRFGGTRDDILRALVNENIEARPVWKPLHLQPVFSGCGIRGGSVSEDLFERGICLPSGSNLGDDARRRVVDIIRSQSPRR